MSGVMKNSLIQRVASRKVTYKQPRRLLIHAVEEIIVVLRMLQFLQQEFHRIGDAHGHQDAAQDPHLGQCALVDQQFFFPGA